MSGQDELPRLIVESPEATEWVENQKTQYLNLPAFGDIAIGVLWSDATDADGNPIVPIDPAAFIEEININGLPVLKGHDPGFPVGKVLTAKVFTNLADTRFIAAILGLYAGGNRLRLLISG